eukprot:gb/GECG01001176.1/.p1 GENE.gb/GECG01001176.1/~~gb/GECG01001176.1/.p1  ORF type:complete len:120 (+),score=6.54 gb/GECG01001176.1/:1-360(+)
MKVSGAATSVSIVAMTFVLLISTVEASNKYAGQLQKMNSVESCPRNYWVCPDDIHCCPDDENCCGSDGYCYPYDCVSFCSTDPCGYDDDYTSGTHVRVATCSFLTLSISLVLSRFASPN